MRALSTYVRDFFRRTHLLEKIVQNKFPRFIRYGLGIFFALSGLALGLCLREATGRFAVSLSVLSTMMAGIAGGFGPGILAAVISSIGADYFLGVPMGGLVLANVNGWVRAGVLTVLSISVGVLTCALRSAWAKADLAREKAQKADLEKDAMIAFLSHDLRAPLSSILLSFHLLEKCAETGGKEREIARLAGNGIQFCQGMARLSA